MAEEIDVLQITNALRELNATKEKYQNLRNFFDEKSSTIFNKISEIESNNKLLIDEVKSVLSELNPFLNNNVSTKSRGKRRTGIKIIERNNTILQFFRENQTESLSLGDLTAKWNVPNGYSTQSVKKFLINHPEIQTRNDVNHRNKLMYSYKKNVPKSDIKLSDKIKKGDDIGFGVVEENNELSESMPKKFSYMK